MPNPDLHALADRAEGAEAGEQHDVLLEAFSAITGGVPDGTNERAEWFELRTKLLRMLDAEAYESAALMLVPEGWCWCFADYKGEANPTTWQGQYQNAHGWASLTALDDAMTCIRSNATTPALALVAASLRAHAVKEEG